MTDDLARAWPPFGVRVTCGPLVMRAVRDTDFPEVLDLLHRGVHAPDEAPFYVAWTDAKGAELERNWQQHEWRQRVELTPESWGLDLGVWHEGRFVGMQGVSTRNFAITRTGETGSWLGLEHHGQGIGTLMRQAICVLCFDHLGFTEVTSGAFADNPSSLGVSRKVGYVLNGAQRLARKGEVASSLSLVLSPDDLVRPPHDVEVAGAQEFLEFVQARAT